MCLTKKVIKKAGDGFFLVYNILKQGYSLFLCSGYLYFSCNKIRPKNQNDGSSAQIGGNREIRKICVKKCLNGDIWRTPREYEKVYKNDTFIKKVYFILSYSIKITLEELK